MIKNKKDLVEFIKADNCNHWEKNTNKFILFLRQDEFYHINKYFKLLRKQEFYANNIVNRKVYILFYYLYTFRKNRLGNKLNIIIPENTLGIGVTICHKNIVINPNSKIGKYSILHGNNCIGNDGINDKAPMIGDYTNIGYGACVIGDIQLADYMYIGANAVVNKSFNQDNQIIAGVPAKYRRKKNEI